MFERFWSRAVALTRDVRQGVELKVALFRRLPVRRTVTVALLCAAAAAVPCVVGSILGWAGWLTTTLASVSLLALSVVLLLSPIVRRDIFWWVFVFAWIGAGFGAWFGIDPVLDVWGAFGFLMLIVYVARATYSDSHDLKEKLSIPFRSVICALALLFLLAGLYVLSMEFGHPQVYAPWSALPTLARNWVALQQSSFLHLDSFDSFERLFSGCCGVVGRWRGAVLAEVALAGAAAFFAARSLGFSKSESAGILGIFTFGWWTLGELEWGLVPIWAAPIIFVTVMRRRLPGWVYPSMVVLVLINPAAWLLLAVLTIALIFDRTELPSGGRYGTDVLWLAAAVFLGLTIHGFSSGLETRDQWLLPYQESSLIALGLIVAIAAFGRRKDSVWNTTVICGVAGIVCVGITMLTGGVGDVAHAIFSAQSLGVLLAAVWFGCAALATRTISEFWTPRRAGAAVLVLALVLVAAFPIHGLDKREVRIDDSAAYGRLAQCERGRVADFPVPLRDSLEEHLYVASAQNVGQTDVTLDPSLRSAILSSSQLRSVLRQYKADYIIAHFNDVEVSTGGDIMAIPSVSSFNGLHLLYASLSGTWLYSTHACK